MKVIIRDIMNNKDVQVRFEHEHTGFCYFDKMLTWAEFKQLRDDLGGPTPDELDEMAEHYEDRDKTREMDDTKRTAYIFDWT